MSLLEGNADVSYVEPDRTIHLYANPVPNDPQFKKEWGLNNTGQTGRLRGRHAGRRHRSASGPGASPPARTSVTVGVIDTGIDAAHPDLAANMWINPGENCAGCRNDGIDNDHNGYVDDWRGWDFVNNDNNPTDDNGHGTHVAGTIGAVGNNGIGVAGVNWNVRLMPLKFIGADGTGDVAGAVAALRYATAMGARSHATTPGATTSTRRRWTTPSPTPNAHGDLFVAAAGNDEQRTTIRRPRYPADYDLPNVISVARQRPDRPARLLLELRAGQRRPGRARRRASTRPGRATAYKSESGTSMASPHVAGAAALALAAHPAATADTHQGAAAAHRRPSRRARRHQRQPGPARRRHRAHLQQQAAAGDRRARPGLRGRRRPRRCRCACWPASAADLAGVTVTAAANGQPIALTAQRRRQLHRQFTPAASAPTTVTATATSSGGIRQRQRQRHGAQPDRDRRRRRSPSPRRAGEDALLAFDGTAGTRVSARADRRPRIPSSTVTVRDPDGSRPRRSVVGTGSAFIDASRCSRPAAT